MRVLIRSILGLDKRLDYFDSEIVTDRLTIGRAANQDILLKHPSASLQQAVIESKSGRLHIKSISGVEFIVNDSNLTQTNLNAGDVIEIGDVKIQIIDPPSGFDLAVQVQQNNLGLNLSSKSSNRFFRKDVQSKTRMHSWSLFWICFLVLFGLPFAGIFVPDLLMKFRQASVLSDEYWATGPLQAAHRIPEIGENCQTCHTKPFNRITNDKCLDCHSDVGIHQTTVAEVEALQRCTSCHKEHKEPANVVQTNQKLCIDCHQDIDSLDEAMESKMNVTDFATDHPQFTLSMLTQDNTDSTNWSVKKFEFNESLSEQSNLNFSHKQHLDPRGIQTPRGRQVLVCQTCHKLDLNGQYMQPITMENTCSVCHSLSFEKNDPQRVVPHGNPEFVLLRLEEYYSRVFLENALESHSEIDQEVGIRRVRRPGKNLDESKRALVLQNARAKANEVATILFEKTLCTTCHEISTADSGQSLVPWKVNPVKITSRWMGQAEFDHYQHRTQECSDCHNANESASSHDVLMPGIDTCRECHVGQFDTEKVSTTCVSCHKFHHIELGLYH